MGNDFYISMLTSFSLDLSKKLDSFAKSLGLDKIPVIIANSGDEDYFNDHYGEGVIKQIPRISVTPQNLTVKNENSTEVFNVRYSEIEDNKETPMVTDGFCIPVSFTVDCEMLFNNMMEYLRFLDVYLSNVYKSNTFVFASKGNYYNGYYAPSFDFQQTKNVELPFSNEKKGGVSQFSFDIECDFYSYNKNNAIEAKDTIALTEHNIDSNNNKITNIIE